MQWHNHLLAGKLYLHASLLILCLSIHKLLLCSDVCNFPVLLLHRIHIIRLHYLLLLERSLSQLPIYSIKTIKTIWPLKRVWRPILKLLMKFSFFKNILIPSYVPARKKRIIQRPGTRKSSTFCSLHREGQTNLLLSSRDYFCLLVITTTIIRLIFGGWQKNLTHMYEIHSVTRNQRQITCAYTMQLSIYIYMSSLCTIFPFSIMVWWFDDVSSSLDMIELRIALG